MSKLKSLPVPGAARRDPKSVEMVRGWIAEGKFHLALNVGYWERQAREIDERNAWGIVLADMARHIANAHEEAFGRDRRETFRIIQESFEREAMKPTSTHSGEFPTAGPQPED